MEKDYHETPRRFPGLPGDIQDIQETRRPGDTQETPGDTQETPRRHQEPLRRHPGDTQEAPRRHPGVTRRHPETPRKCPKGQRQPEASRGTQEALRRIRG